MPSTRRSEATKSRRPEGEESRVMTLPGVDASPDVLNRFWITVARLASRTRTSKNLSVGTPKLTHHTALTLALGPCAKCTHSTIKHLCMIEADHPSYRPCREAKIACDRKMRFVFDLTKHLAFDQFLAVSNNKPTEKRVEMQRERKRRRNLSEIATDPEKGNTTALIADGNFQVKLCADCLRAFEYEQRKLRAVSDHDYQEEEATPTALQNALQEMEADGDPLNSR
ncbi:hypothetical protein FB451DRAFT_1401786 [Mycena latifolia]|nr:hypothetical protein FB451DRAFT_1401786 [Mycena latifolia]